MPEIRPKWALTYRFRTRGYKDAVITVPKEPGTRTFELVLQRAAGVKGRVVSARTGEPVGGAIVALIAKGEGLSVDSKLAIEQFAGHKAETVEDGTFKLTGLESSKGAGLMVLKRGSGFCYIPHAQAMIQGGRLELPLPEAGTIHGRVLVGGNPVAKAGARITWSPQSPKARQYFQFSRSVSTDAEGRFRFDGLGPGHYRLLRTVSLKTEKRSIECALQQEEVDLPPGQTVSHDLRRPAGHTVKGRTQDQDGKPLGGCIVEASASGFPPGTIYAVQSDHEGRFEMAHVPAGSIHFVAMHDAESSGRRDASGAIMAKIDGPTEITIRLRPRGQTQRHTAPSLAGAVPPDVTVRFLDSECTLTLSEAFGKVVAIDFWATWCGPCIAIMPETRKLYEQYKDRDDVVFFTVSLDNDEDRLREVIKKQGLEFPVVFSGKGGQDPLAQAFGVRSIPASVVIGRDGRFAADRMHGSQLAAAIKQALAKPLPPAFVGVKPARLTVKLTLDGQPMSLPGVTMRFKAVDKNGKTVLEEKLPLPGAAPQMCWIYPELSGGGTVTVSVAADGVREQVQTVKDPPDEKMVEVAFTSPRTLSGCIAADDGKTPVPGMKVTARRRDGFHRSAITDAQGHFAVRVIPGRYTLWLEGTDAFVLPYLHKTPDLDVPEAVDPEPIELTACRAISISGVIKDVDGKPVAGAKVGLFGRPMGSRAITGAQGQFTLAGVPSTGRVVIFAAKEEINKGEKVAERGVVLRDGIRLDEILEITVRPADEDKLLRAVLSGVPVVGQKSPALKVSVLDDGSPIDWQPAKDANTLVVFCALWHPEGRRLLRAAATWAESHSAHLAAFSIDWYRQQAARELAAMDGPPPVLFAGPSDFGPAAAWHVTPPAQAFLVSPGGKLLPAPKPDELLFSE